MNIETIAFVYSKRR